MVADVEYVDVFVVISLFFSYGVLGGIGMGLSYLSSVVIVGLYFEKRRATGEWMNGWSDQRMNGWM